jgi:hypothetical protein
LKLFSYEWRRINGLKFRLWSKQYFTEAQAWKVVIRYRRRVAPWAPYWAYISLLPGQPPCEIGPIDQYTMEEALKVAKQQYRAQLEKQADDAYLDYKLSGPGKVDGESQRIIEERMAPPMPMARFVGYVAGVPTFEPPPGVLPDAKPLKPRHVMAVEIQPQSNYRIACCCGWKSQTTAVNHLCIPENCPQCAAVYCEWEKHRVESKNPLEERTNVES